MIDTIAIPIPKQSNVYEGVVKKGWESLKQEVITVCEHSLQTIYSHSTKYPVEVL
jgi:hypothetical protein